MTEHEVQTIKLTRAAACEAISEAFNGVSDWKGATIAEMAYEIVRKLGFK